MPRKLFLASAVSRLNSGGFSFAEVPATDALFADMSATLARTDFSARPLIAGDAMRGAPLDALSPVTLEKIGVICPTDGGELAERKTRKGRVFYGCVNYPACDFTSWKRPLPQPCPNCGGLLVVANKNFAQCIKCETSVELSLLATPEQPVPELA